MSFGKGLERGTAGIIVIIPAFNEKGKIVRVLRKIPKELVSEIVVVNDGSTDDTPDQARSEGVTVLSHISRKGIGTAIRTGIDYALKKKYDIIVVLAGNDKDNPLEINRLIKPLMEGYDFVQGSRYIHGGKRNKMPLHRQLFTRLYSLAFRITTGTPITDATNGFRAYKTSIFKDSRINIWQDWLNHSLEYYLSLKVAMLGYRVKEVPVTKLYPQNVSYNEYTKIKPFSGWWERLKPLIFLTLGSKK